MFNSILNWLWFDPQALEKELDDEVCAYYGCCGFRSSKPISSRHENGQFKPKSETPLHLRDILASREWAYKTHRVKFKNHEALVIAFNQEREV